MSVYDVRTKHTFRTIALLAGLLRMCAGFVAEYTLGALLGSNVHVFSGYQVVVRDSAARSLLQVYSRKKKCLFSLPGITVGEKWKFVRATRRLKCGLFKSLRSLCFFLLNTWFNIRVTLREAFEVVESWFLSSVT